MDLVLLFELLLIENIKQSNQIDIEYNNNLVRNHLIKLHNTW